jgi:two-component system cell cycle response regulator
LYSEKLLATSERYNQPFCLIILDIDHFKKINDTYSHRVGDLILQKLAHVVQSTIRQGDIFVRLGGEEFALILPNTTLKEGFNTAERVRRSIQAANFNFKGNHIPVTVSLGVSQYSKGPIEQTFDQADRALYQAKANGRNQVMKF